MQSYLDHAPCLYFSSSDDGNLLEVNDRLCSVLQYRPEELAAKKIEVLLTISSRIFQQTHFFPLLKMQGHAEEIFITLQRKDGGHIPVLINAERKIVNGTAVNIHVGIVVHNRKKFEDELIAAKRFAENAVSENSALLQAKQQLQKHAEELDHQISISKKQNEELLQFNRVVTHDMQEPLRKLSFFSGMLLDSDGRQDPKRLVEKIRKVSLQMHNTLSGLQQYVWLNETPLNIQTLDLPSLLEKLSQQLKTEFPDVNLIIDSRGLSKFEGDVDQIPVLFYHLFSNAIRFKKENEPVKVSILTEQIRLNQFRHVQEKYKYVDYTRIQVKDHGKGFPPEFKSQVFELFRRLHHESGRGIGLSLSKKIIDNHRGMISIDSKVGEGTVVTIQLPHHFSNTVQDSDEVAENTTDQQ